MYPLTDQLSWILNKKCLTKEILENFFYLNSVLFHWQSLHQAVGTQEKLNIKCILVVSKRAMKETDFNLFRKTRKKMREVRKLSIIIFFLIKKVLGLWEDLLNNEKTVSKNCF